MNLKLLIDGIVRQTTVLIAQLSTAEGIRAPLARVAGEVFLELAREIERQGVGKKVVADMFGLALRSYQRKLQRLVESRTDTDRTLWQAVLDRLGEGSCTRRDLMQRFAADGESEVAAVLKDLTTSGFAHVSGTGDSSVYGLTSASERSAMQETADAETLSSWIWLLVFQREATTPADLAQHVNTDPKSIDEALEQLLRSGRVRVEGGQLVASNIVLPHGSTQGWETALLDHFRAVTKAMASKVRSGVQCSDPDDRIGGTTVTFTVFPGHPHAERVYGLLARVRDDVQSLWEQVARENQTNPPDAARAERVTFYVGQNVELPEPTEPQTSDPATL